MALRRIQHFMKQAVHYRRLAIGHPAETAPVYPPLHLLPTATPSATAAAGDLFFHTAGEPSFHNGTVWTRLPGLVAVGPAMLDAASVDRDVWVADRAYTLVAVKATHSVIGGAAATVKELTAANIGLETTINTVVTPALSATAADLDFAAGNRLALDFSGTLTGLVGQLTFYLRPI